MKKIKQTLLAIMLVLLMANISAYAAESHMKNSIKTHQATLWQLINELIDHPSFTLDTIGQVLPVEFTKRGDNGYSAFYEGGPIHLTDQVVVKTATLAIRHNDGISRLIGLDLSPSGTCVTIDEVYAHYDNTEIIGTPRGDSLAEETTWAVRYPWGRLAFGFKESNRDCLASVGIRRNETHSTSKNHPQDNSHQ